MYALYDLGERLRDQRTRKLFTPEIPRKTVYHLVPNKEQNYFLNVLRDKVCNSRSRGLWQGIVDREPYQPIDTQAAQKIAIAQLEDSPFNRVKQVAIQLNSCLSLRCSEADRQFYRQLLSLLRYVPNPEFTIEYKVLFSNTKIESLQHLPCDYIPNFVDALITVYCSPQSNRFDQARLRRFMDDITQHQQGKSVLDVRNVYRKASSLYQRYTSAEQKGFGWALMAIGLVLVGLSITAIVTSSPWLLGPLIHTLFPASSLSAHLAGAIGLAMMVFGVSCARHRPFFRSKRYDVLRYKAREIHPHFEYIFLTDSDSLRDYHQFYQHFAACLNTEIAAQFNRQNAYAWLNFEEHWVHHPVDKMFIPIDDVSIEDTEQVSDDGDVNSANPPKL